MVFEESRKKISRILEYRREGTQPFDFTIDKIVESTIRGGRGIGWRDPDIPSFKLILDREEGVSVAPDYLSYVEIRQEHHISESLVKAWREGHTIRLRGEYDLKWLSDSIFSNLLVLPLGVISIADLYRGQIVVEDRSTGQEIQTFNTAFKYWYGEPDGFIFGEQPTIYLPPVEVDKGIGYHMLQAGLDPAEHPVNEAADYLMVLSCGYCNTGMLYSQPRTSAEPKKRSLSCSSCGSKDLTTLYQNF